MSVSLPIFIAAPLIFTAGIVFGELADRAWTRFAPPVCKRFAKKALWYYLYPFRRFMPDTVYKLWLRTGIMSPEAYREFQEHGFITDTLDPEYIQQYTDTAK